MLWIVLWYLNQSINHETHLNYIFSGSSKSLLRKLGNKFHFFFFLSRPCIRSFLGFFPVVKDLVRYILVTSYILLSFPGTLFSEGTCWSLSIWTEEELCNSDLYFLTLSTRLRSQTSDIVVVFPTSFGIFFLLHHQKVSEDLGYFGWESLVSFWNFQRSLCVFSCTHYKRLLLHSLEISICFWS